MLEWLSCGECYDVQLSCGGRVFNAHRAVLASVSSFLRCLLLSCPVEDNPTYIVLPEFEQDAVVSVLYYIYNGEVLIPTSKLKMFLDTVKALQIFIDSQYLTENTEICKESCNKNDKWTQSEFCNDDNLNTSHFKRQPQARIQKCTASVSIPPMMQKTSYYTNLENKQSEIDTNTDILGHSHCDNGPMNKLFQSRLFTNSLNGTNYQLNDRLEISSEYNQKKLDPLKKVPSSKNCDVLVSSYYDKITDVNKGLHKKSKNTQVRSLKKMEHKIEELENIRREKSESCIINEKSNKNTSKLTIHNEVLQSPWRPQLPRSYRSFCMQKYAMRKKSESEDTKIVIVTINNDKNNNADAPSLPSSEKKMDPKKSQVSQDPTGEDKKCSGCCQIFHSAEAYNIHIQHSCTTRYTCSDCNKTFSQLRNFKYHMSKHRGTKEFATTCPVCGKYFNDRGYLSSHMKIHRNRKEYKCSLCPKSFNQRVAYNMHLRIHTGVKPHVCDECGKAFSRKMLLKQHQRTHSGERPYACPHCDKKFADRSNMTLHLRLHTGVKPFGCSECGKSFTKKHHLQSHMNFHTGVKPYSCPKCKLAFTQSSNMRTHLKKCFAEESSATK